MPDLDRVNSLSRTEESRSLLQERLSLMHRIGFAISAIFLLAILTVRGTVGDGVMSELRAPSRWFHMAAALLTGLFWWALRRRKLSFDVLELVDAVGVLGIALCLNLNAGLFEIRTVAVFNLVLTTGVALLLRAIVVPSTARRTLVLGLAASAVALAIFFASALHPGWPVSQRGPADWPLAFQLISATLWLGVLVAMATVASRVIYNLRRDVSSALKLGQYTLGEKIGAGGMGVVYHATHAMLRRETAIKLLSPDRVDAKALRRFEREVVLTAKLHHPNTIVIFDYGRTLDGVFYYAMEYLRGLTLAQLVQREGPLPPGRVVHLLAQACSSLEEAHAAGLVHRDIKPANIMVVGNPAAYDMVKVLDFGLVRTLAPGARSSLQSTTDMIVGTPLYLAPEAIADPDHVDGRSDLYALAAVGYLMLAGKNPFEGESLIEVCAAHLHSQPPPIHQRLGRAVPEDLEALLLSGLSKSPSQRPQTAAAFREALLSCDVPPWTDRDAREWWQRYRADESRLARSEPELADPIIPVKRMPADWRARSMS